MKVTRALYGALLLSLSLASVARAQATGPFNITTQDAGNCATANACVELQVFNNPTLAWDVSGTFSATLSFEASTNNRATWRSVVVTLSTDLSSVTSTTTGGTFVVNNAGFTHVRVRAGTYASGTVVVYGTIGYQSARAGGSGAGLTGAGGLVLKLASDVTTGADTNPVDLTGIVFTAAPAKTYHVTISAFVTAAAATSGYGIGVNCAQTPVIAMITGVSPSNNSGASSSWDANANNSVIGRTSAIPQNGQETPVVGGGIIQTHATLSGTCQFIFIAEVGTGPPTMKAGSIFIVREVA